MDKWNVAVVDCPQQINFADCGVFMCINMNWLEMGKELIYNILTPEEDKPKFANDENDKKQSQKKRKVILFFDFKPLIYIQL